MIRLGTVIADRMKARGRSNFNCREARRESFADEPLRVALQEVATLTGRPVPQCGRAISAALRRVPGLTEVGRVNANGDATPTDCVRFMFAAPEVSLEPVAVASAAPAAVADIDRGPVASDNPRGLRLVRIGSLFVNPARVAWVRRQPDNAATTQVWFSGLADDDGGDFVTVNAPIANVIDALEGGAA